MKLTFYVVALIILISLAPDALASCPTMQPGPPCVEYWQKEAVFIGTANRVVPTPNKPSQKNWTYVQTTVYFTIEETFKGIEGGAIVFNLDHCGYPFKEGERYLVYAHRNPNNNELEVRAGWTRTRPLAEAAEDLEYIRGLSTAEPGSRLFGRVVHYDLNLKEARGEAEALQNIKVILEGTNQLQEAVTDSEGRYEFRRIPAGTYRVRAEVPAALTHEEQTLKLKGRECVQLDIGVTPKGQISGRVVDSNGKPVGSVPIWVVPADVPLEQYLPGGRETSGSMMTYTGHDGRYRFTQLAPGRYLLIINLKESDKLSGSEISRLLPRLFYPGVSDLGGATVIVVGKERKAREYEFRLPIEQ